MQEHVREQDERSAPAYNKCVCMNEGGFFGPNWLGSLASYCMATNPAVLAWGSSRRVLPLVHTLYCSSRAHFVLRCSSRGRCLWAQLGMNPVKLLSLTRLTSLLTQLERVLRTVISCAYWGVGDVGV